MKKITLILLIIFALAISALTADTKKNEIFKPDNEYIREINLNINNLTLNVGESYTFSFRTVPSNTRNERLTWTTNNSKIVTISDNGRIRAIAKGSTTIRVRTSNGKEDSCKVTVTSNQYTNISLNKRQLDMYVNETYELKAKITPEKIFKEKVYWSSSNNRVATVDNNGKVRATGRGYATITATIGRDGVRSSCYINVSNGNNNNDNLSISLNRKSLTLRVNDDYRLYATIYPNNYNNKRIYWDSSNDRVATVDDNGRIRTRSNGQVIITASIDRGISDSCRVTVGNGRDDYNYVYLNRTNLNLSPGDSYDLIATVQYGNSRNLKWTSSNTNVASVNDNGRVKAKRTGTTTITVSTKEGRRDTCYIRVENGINYNDPQIELNRNSLTLNIGETFVLTAKVKDSSLRVVGLNVWSSNNPRVATVDSNGKVTAKSSGNATITFKSSNSYKTCYVRVTGDNNYYNNRDDHNIIKREDSKEINRDENIFRNENKDIKRENSKDTNKDENKDIKREDNNESKKDDNKNINKEDVKDVKKEDNEQKSGFLIRK